MIQRIQSIYLLLAILALVFVGIGKNIFTKSIEIPTQFSLFIQANGLGIQSNVTPLPSISTENTQLLQAAIDGKDLSIGKTTQNIPVESLPIFPLFLLIALFGLITLFKFKQLKRQYKLSRLVFFGTLLCLVLSGVLFYLFNNTASDISTNSTTLFFDIGSYCIVAAVVFSWLAMRAIHRDLKLVQSVDRIR